MLEFAPTAWGSTILVYKISPKRIGLASLAKVSQTNASPYELNTPLLYRNSSNNSNNSPYQHGSEHLFVC
jgi:hypothetical protein